MKAFFVISTIRPDEAVVARERAIATAGIDDVKVHIIIDEHKTGAVKHLNTGYKMGYDAGAKYIGSFNDDLKNWPDGWLARMIEALDENPLYLTAVTAGMCRSGPQRNCSPDSPKETRVIKKGAWFCVLLKRKAFDEIGYMDERFSHYSFDYDYSFRVNEAGYKNILVKDVYLHHEVHKPIMKWWRADPRKLKEKRK